ncbi:DNA-directed RNA polymerase, subunit E [Archaeoglobus sulfaticallidus PM70-1]|uniref:DNA-directed RNA polymerase subunit Rpo7 n=1 Tax=Archaeoglobus sulfaticallidus PM70-1 TaxID=387631 RepID=N0BAV1_9EURY|nr:DNA-directed RNA polymerase [Archaeoglobus sulfaticallidus]AGK60123.1 DNA-directed RNA polymerase, subunit E [Archaeoglobus sulfaticallidus PM70-1]
MYARMKIRDTVRVPPTRFEEDIEEVIEDLLWEQFEGKLDKEYGMIVGIESIEEIGDGRIIEGDGAVYFDVVFNAITFKPLMQEVIEGEVIEIVEFGAFVNIGPLDGLIHMSQITEDYVVFDDKNKRLIGKETKKSLQEGDFVRARIVALSLKEREPEKSKIGLTMRQPWLGNLKWIDEDIQKLMKEKENI